MSLGHRDEDNDTLHFGGESCMGQIHSGFMCCISFMKTMCWNKKIILDWKKGETLFEGKREKGFKDLLFCSLSGLLVIKN